MTDVEVSEVRIVASRVSRSVARDFAGYVDVDDIAQDLMLWALDHPEKVTEYLTPTDDDPTCKVGKRKLHTTMRRKARGWAHRAKADTLGYEVRDLHFYSLASLEELLPEALDYEAWLPSADCNGASTTPTDPAMGNNKFALLADVKGAYESGSDADRALLWARFVAVPVASTSELAESAGVSRATMHRKINRALSHMLDRLGGARPDFGTQVGRKAMSNAQAQAMTRRLL